MPSAYISVGWSTRAVLEWTSLLSGLLASMLTVMLVAGHARNLRWPDLQRYVMRVLLFLPMLYLGTSLSFLWPTYEAHFSLIDAVYEPIAFHGFYMIITVYLGGRDGVLAVMRQADTALNRPICLCMCKCVPKYHSYNHALQSYEWRLAQFMVLHPLLAVVDEILHVAGIHNSIIPIIGILKMVTVIIAMTSLLVLEKKVLHHGMESLKASQKFWAIKLCVLLTIVQKRIVEIIAETGAFSEYTEHTLETTPYEDLTASELSSRFLGGILMIEMLFVLLPMFVYAYSYNKNKEVIVRLAPTPIQPPPQKFLESLTYWGPYPEYFYFIARACSCSVPPDPEVPMTDLAEIKDTTASEPWSDEQAVVETDRPHIQETEPKRGPSSYAVEMDGQAGSSAPLGMSPIVTQDTPLGDAPIGMSQQPNQSKSPLGNAPIAGNEPYNGSQPHGQNIAKPYWPAQ